MSLGLTAPVQSLRIDADGVVRVGATRVTLDTVISAFNEGFGAEEISQQFATVSLPDVYATIAYYLQHQTEVDACLSQRRIEGAELRRTSETRWDPRGLPERLLERRRTAV